MNTTALADLAILMCMIPAIALLWAIFLIPPYKGDDHETP